MKSRIVASPGFNRWRIPPVAIAIHLCIGSVYSWSIFNPALTKELGVVTSAADDWSIRSVVWIFSVAIVFLGLSATVAGMWLEKVGPRLVGGGVRVSVGGRVHRWGRGCAPAPALAAVSGLWRVGRHRPGDGVRFSGVDADTLVPRPPGHGDRDGDHGLRRRCDNRCAAQGVPDQGLLRVATVPRPRGRGVADYRAGTPFRPDGKRVGGGGAGRGCRRAGHDCTRGGGGYTWWVREARVRP